MTEQEQLNYRNHVETLSNSLFVVLGIYAVLLAEWGFGSFVPGAAANASGVAAVLSLAETFHSEPIRDAEIVFLLTGCEESGLLGATAWIDQDPETSLKTEFVNIDCIGMGSTRYLGWEVPVIYRLHNFYLNEEQIRMQV